MVPQGYDVVYVRRTNRKESWWLRACYYLFYRLLAALSSVQLPLDAGDFGLMSRRVVKRSAGCRNSTVISAGCAPGWGFARSEYPWSAPPVTRAAPNTVPQVAQARIGRDFCFFHRASSRRCSPGAGAIGLSFLFALYSLYAKFRLHSPQGFTALILAIMFFSGLNLFFLGIIGEYVGRVYEETKGRPHYVVLKIVRHDAASSRAEKDTPPASVVYR